MTVPKTKATTIAELKRAGLPFDPTRLSNWYGGILESLMSKTHQTDRIDLLAERTLKQMDILTRNNRRIFMLKQVDKAIRKLCSLNVLNLYRMDRVRLQDGISRAKLDRYLQGKPLPWDGEVIETEPSHLTHTQIKQHTLPWEIKKGNSIEGVMLSGEESGIDDGFGAVIGADDDTVDTNFLELNSGEDDPPFDTPICLPRIDRINIDVEKNTDCSFGNSTQSLDDPWIKDSELALSKLLNPDTSPGTLATGSEAITQTEKSLTAEPELNLNIPEYVELPLKPLVEALIEIDPTIRIVSNQHKTVVMSPSPDCEIELVWRRNGEVRVFVGFPQKTLENVLRYIGTAWADLVVGIDQGGKYGVQKIFSLTIPPRDIATRLLRDVQLLEDAMVK